jgi:filamentous hemagglutinin
MRIDYIWKVLRKRGLSPFTRVLEHAEPNPNKPTHTVFSMDRKDILGVVDEAWLKKGSPVVGDLGAYVVPMGRVVGTAGETNIKVIVRPGTNAVLSAYPVP